MTREPTAVSSSIVWMGATRPRIPSRSSHDAVRFALLPSARTSRRLVVAYEDCIIRLWSLTAGFPAKAIFPRPRASHAGHQRRRPMAGDRRRGVAARPPVATRSTRGSRHRTRRAGGADRRVGVEPRRTPPRRLRRGRLGTTLGPVGQRSAQPGREVSVAGSRAGGQEGGASRDGPISGSLPMAGDSSLSQNPVGTAPPCGT